MARHKLAQWVLFLEELLVFYSTAPRTDALGPGVVSSREGGFPPPQGTASSLRLTHSRSFQARECEMRQLLVKIPAAATYTSF